MSAMLERPQSSLQVATPYVRQAASRRKPRRGELAKGAERLARRGTEQEDGLQLQRDLEVHSSVETQDTVETQGGVEGQRNVGAPAAGKAAAVSAVPAALMSPDAGPWSGFPLAAQAAVRDLHGRFGLDLWMVTHVQGDRQEVVAAVGPWQSLASPGIAFSWATSFCRRMVNEDGPVAEPDVHASAGFAPIAVGAFAQVRAYVGVPLISADGRLFGTLCAYSGQRQPASLSTVLEPTQVVGRMLSTILAGEQIAAAYSQDAATAYALAERDRLTGLRNRRGWESSLATEEQRVRRYGSPVSVLALDLDGLKDLNDAQGHPAGDAALVAFAGALRDVCRPGDALARTGGDEFGVLAVECDMVSVRALAVRLRVRLRAVGVAASVGCATRRAHEALEQTWRRADAAMYRDKRRRRRGHAGTS